VKDMENKNEPVETSESRKRSEPVETSESKKKTYEDLITDLVKQGEDINKNAVEILGALKHNHSNKLEEIMDVIFLTRISEVEPRYRRVINDYLKFSLVVSDTISKLSKVREVVKGDKKVKVGYAELQYILARLSFVQSQENLTNTILNSIHNELTFRRYTQIYILALLVSFVAVVISLL
jgi:hypothetical protein